MLFFEVIGWAFLLGCACAFFIAPIIFVIWLFARGKGE